MFKVELMDSSIRVKIFFMHAKIKKGYQLALLKLCAIQLFANPPLY